MQKIVPCLWFDNNAQEAVTFYTSLFKDSKIVDIIPFGDAGPGKKGDSMAITFELQGQSFSALNGGPNFKFTPAISLFVGCDTEKEQERLWKNLSEGGTVLMEMGKYPFSERYGWVQDRFGLSWQINLGKTKQKVMPFLMFVQSGKALEAMKFYLSTFSKSEVISLEKSNDAVKLATFSLAGTHIMTHDSNFAHGFNFTPAISFFVHCKDQYEVNEYWKRLSAIRAAERCGWLQDKYGISWQIVPTILTKMLKGKDRARAERAMKTVLQMKKLDVLALEKAYKG